MTDITDFEDIRPYNDTEVRTVLDRLVEDPELHNVIVLMKFPRLNKWFGGILRFFVRRALRRTMGGINTVSQLQNKISKQLEGLLRRVCAEVTVSGLEQLDASKSYLFISNHRDIAMDPAMVDLALHRSGRDTVRIAIGDNLLSKPFTSDLMRINKSFIVRRSVAGRREKLAALLQLSSYIRHSLINENSSIWIAQQEGRAKNGKDKTDKALIKMLTLSKQKSETFSDAIADLNLVPVAISYELDPCDNDKARELHAIRSEGVYRKQEHEDLLSIYRGLVGEKGHVHVAFGTPITGLDSADSVATEVDRQIFDIYRLHPTNIIAYQQLYGSNNTVDQWKAGIQCKNWQAIEDRFNDRMANIDSAYRDLAIASYANPVCSRLDSLGK
ncbi:MAG: 1-acyl-sn-glycerol-3-phosphate acyltransferase [Porticoccaceae bacterium]|nr:1-acyl-sn-glycerol-3-phosphate acyltransferase [Pseudomonadales bacterium]MCP5170807.1 1-acyl-sn-glycerol-3-phosphate acyltransferase [Pseudomonadales bacterium]MCP5301953.1 1-acyl-sn-glycerol-3-phosphate acyltransferase [Pseudomonadales bacterium]